MTADSRSHPDALDEIVAKYLRAIENGEKPNRDDLLARHPALVDELREFFADHDRMARLAQPLCEPTLAHPASLAAERIRYFGDYEILEEIARGGMGVVFKARQVSLNRVVAIKMILSGQLASPENVERFHTEAEAAAKLDHPGIVPIYEVGQHEGQHYFSMGYVEGQSLSARVTEGPLPAREAAEIVRAIAQAVQYAHDQGVIHRDLKPGNILLDRLGKPRITDFGLAKLTESGSDLTGTGQILGTPGYMPPEQAAAQVSAVGRLSDIYSLGAILYCLLTGRPPFQAASAIETLRQVQEQDPLAPRQLNPAIPLDLDTIALKCLEKSPTRRYASAQQVADELGRFADGRPIVARPIGTTARLVRWCRRKPAVAALSAASIVATAIAIGVLLVSRAAVNSALNDKIAAFEKLQIEERKVREALAAKTAALEREQMALLGQQSAVRHERMAREDEVAQRLEVERQKSLVEEQRDRAIAAERTAKEEKEFARESQADTEAFSDFLVHDVLSVARPEKVQGGLGVNITVAQALEAAESKLEQRFKGRPLAEAIARDAMGKTFRNLDKAALAEKHLRRAVELREQELGPDDPQTLDSRNSLGVALMYLGRAAEALELHIETQRRFLATLGEDHQETLMNMSNLAEAYRKAGMIDKAMPLLEQSFEKMEAKLGPDHPETVRCMSNLGLAYQQNGKLEMALALLERALQKREAEFGLNHSKTLSSMNNLASAYHSAGRIDESLQLHDQALQRQIAALGPDHLDVLTSMNNLATTYHSAGRIDRAVELHQRVLARLKAKLGVDHSYTLGSMMNLGSSFQSAGKADQAEPLFREAIAGWRRLPGDHQARILQCQRCLAACYVDLPQLEKGETVWRELVALGKAQPGPPSSQYASDLASLAQNLLRQNKPAEAEPFLRESLLIREKLQPGVWATLQCKSWLVDSLLEQQKYSDAETLLMSLYATMKERESKPPFDGAAVSSNRQQFLETLDRLIRLSEATNQIDNRKKWQAEKATLSTDSPTQPR